MSGRRLVGPDVDYSKVVLGPAVGGSGKRSAAETAQAIGLLTKAAVAADARYLKLGQDGYVEVQHLPKDKQTISNSVNGPTTMSANSSANFTIADYDAFTTYTVEAVAGSVSRAGNIITYNAPSGGGVHGFLLNGKRYNVTVTGITVNKANLVTPVNNAANQGPVVSATIAAFSVSGGTDTYKLTEWEVSTDIDFINKIVDTTTVGLALSITLPTAGADYYIHGRHQGNTYGLGQWSDVVKVTAKSSFVPSLEVAKLNATPTANAQLGESVAVSGDGKTIVAGEPWANNGKGKVHIFTEANGIWSEVAVLTDVNNGDNSYFGNAVDVNSDGTVIVIGANCGTNSKTTNGGIVYIYRKETSAYNLKYKVDTDSTEPNQNFGYSLSLSSDGQTLLACSFISLNAGTGYIFNLGTSTYTKVELEDFINSGNGFGSKCKISGDGTFGIVGASLSGTVHLYRKVGPTSWTKEKAVTSPTGQSSSGFGNSVSTNVDGTLFVTGAINESVGAVTASGNSYLFTRTGTVWDNGVAISPSDPVSGLEFGRSIDIDSTGTVIAVGAANYVDGSSATGAVYVFDKDGQVWNQSKLLASDKIAGDIFGYSLSIAGNKTVIAVGVPVKDLSGQANSGAVYVFK